jgi:hypothetical protein
MWIVISCPSIGMRPISMGWSVLLRRSSSSRIGAFAGCGSSFRVADQESYSPV